MAEEKASMNEARRPEAPGVSVLMSCYNGGRWLGEAIESVLAQTFTNFEFIMVDDGSADDTPEIIKRYAAKDQRIVFIPKPNTGLADSLNAGIAKARGAWIARVDQDDLCEPARLEKQLAFAEARPGLVLLGSGFAEINEAGEVVAEHRYSPGHRALVSRLERIQAFFPHSSAFYRAETARQAGGYNKRITRAEDQRFWLELSTRGELACLPDLLVKIRKHPGQMSLHGSGIRQICDAAAATVCHLLAKAGQKDPSASKDEAEWTAFREWVGAKVDEYGIPEQRKAWWEARERYIASGGGLAGLLRFGADLSTSGHALALLRNKIFGSTLPGRLAAEWAARVSGQPRGG